MILAEQNQSTAVLAKDFALAGVFLVKTTL